MEGFEGVAETARGLAYPRKATSRFSLANAACISDSVGERIVHSLSLRSRKYSTTRHFPTDRLGHLGRQSRPCRGQGAPLGTRERATQRNQRLAGMGRSHPGQCTNRGACRPNAKG